MLVLTANPLATSKLELREEVQAIRDALQGRSVTEEAAAKIQDLSALMARHQPSILHFSGHGTETGDLQFEDDSGKAVTLKLQALGQILKEYRHKLRCIVLNACYSSANAAVLAGYVDCIVGMSSEIAESDALAFATGFYRGLASSTEDVPRAFRLGCNEIDVRQLPDSMVPRLRTADREVAQFPMPPNGRAEPTRRFSVRVEDYDLLGKSPEHSYQYTVWYGTNRAPLDPQDEGRGPERSR